MLHDHQKTPVVEVKGKGVLQSTSCQPIKDETTGPSVTSVDATSQRWFVNSYLLAVLIGVALEGMIPLELDEYQDHLKMEMEMEIPSVKASANSDIIFFFTSAQDGNKLLDDERLSLADDLKKAHDQNQNKSK
ncbi:hypothetical protein Tco_1182235 [Tanacetum coccineum]